MAYDRLREKQLIEKLGAVLDSAKQAAQEEDLWKARLRLHAALAVLSQLEGAVRSRRGPQ